MIGLPHDYMQRLLPYFTNIIQMSLTSKVHFSRADLLMDSQVIGGYSDTFLVWATHMQS